MLETHNLEITQVHINNLRPDPANPRRISDEELDSLTRSLQQFGFVQPVLAAGRTRWSSAASTGW